MQRLIHHLLAFLAMYVLESRCFPRAQDPVMFCGTMRENLDPFGHSDDVTIWAALEAARLSSYVSGLDGKLDSEVGGRLSRRQKVCTPICVVSFVKIESCDWPIGDTVCLCKREQRTS